MITRKGATAAQNQALYQSEESFVDLLPWVEAIDGAIMLDDGVSLGAVFEIQPKATEGRTTTDLAEVRDSIAYALQDSFEEHDEAPWIIQTYTFNEPELSGFMQSIEDYVKPSAKGTAFTEAYLDILHQHYKGICKPGGLFHDETVTRSPWRGCRQRSYVVIYRRSDDATLSGLNDACDRLFNAIRPSGIQCRKMSGVEFHRWLTRWFNRYTDENPDSPLGLADMVEHGDDALPFGNQFSESLFYSYPESNAEKKYWRFDQTFSRCLTVEGIRRRPDVGQMTGEMDRGEATNTVMDLLPEGTIMMSTVVVVPADTTEAFIDSVGKSAKGDSSEAARTKTDCATAKELLGDRNKLYRAKFAFYINANSPEELNRRSQDARSVLLNQGLQAMAHKHDVKALDNYISNLPMKYDADKDRKAGWTQAKLTWTQHIANLSCFFGRSTGTGHPGIVQSNRGGEPLCFDPLNKKDRQKNAHMFIVGPPGAGKSVTLAGTLTHSLAISRPRLFVIEAGNSFGLLADWYQSLGLTVNSISLKPGTAPALPTFKDAHLILGTDDEHADFRANEFGLDDTDDDAEDEKRDVLGEMETIATLMVTGGEEKEFALLRRSDRSVIRQAVIQAARDTEGRETLTEDVRDAFFTLAKLESDAHSQQTIRNMGKAIGLFCDGFSGDVFNKPGDIWPEADVTLIDLAQFAREGYEAHLAIALVGVLNVINNIAERDQHDDREIIVAIDESHIITTNPLLSPYLVKMSKMWRKLGAWLWLATQNMEDFPGSAKKLLNMIEWWICLVMPKQEIEEIERFKSLTLEQKKMLLSASKADRQFTEGVVLSSNIDVLFRSVPPSLMLTLAMTEKHEKAERHALMEKHNVDEVGAAVIMAKQIDAARGIVA